MTFLEAIVLGAVQGLTEFLPISSSAHLILIPEIFGWSESGLIFDVAVHVATLFAIIIAFWSDLGKLITGLREGKKEDIRFAKYLAIGTIPILVIGLAFGDLLDAVRSPFMIAGSLIFWGALLAVAEWISRARIRFGHLTSGRAFLIGCAQAVALIPGTSRSGATITLGLFAGLTKESAARFSFLLAIPTILAAALKTGIDVMQTGFDVPLPILLAGALSALIFGLLAIQLLLLVIRRSSLAWFALYRILLGIAILWFAVG